jgi:neopullulanase
MKKYFQYILLILIYWFSINVLSAQIKHVEPLNWWIGFKNPVLQLLINGNNIAETTPKINYAGVTLQKVKKGDSENYLFLDLLIAKNTKPGSFKIDFLKNGKVLYSVNYSILPKQQPSEKFIGFNSSDAIYLITPDRFVNGDSSNDVFPAMKEPNINRGLECARHGGDIRGIINSLDYIQNMGFTAIWPTPMLENDMPAYSYHGYAITNHYKVDSRFGTLDDYIELSKKAKKKGIKLIFDLVLNHTGLNYWWKNDLPFINWLNFTDKYQVTNHRRTVNQDKYASQFDKKLMTEGWFDTAMPDMNSKNAFLSNHLIQNTIWWIETLQLGGIRQDTYGYSDKEFLKKWSCAIADEYPSFTTLGEEWSINPLVTSYWQAGKKNADGYNGCLNSIMDFPLQNTLIASLKEKETSETGLVKLYEGLANDFVYANPDKIMVMTDNHDMDRIYTQFNHDQDLTKMALAYLLTVRGIPQIYYGTEVLMQNSDSPQNHCVIRSDFPGGWPADSVNSFTGKGLTINQLDMQNYLKTLLNWRKNNEVIANGKILHFAPIDGVYVFFRYNNSKIVMVVMNKNDNEVELNTSQFIEILKGKNLARNILNNDKITINKTLKIPQKATTIFEIE